MKKFFNLFMAALVAVSLSSCGGGDDPAPGPGPETPLDVTVENLAGEWKLTAWAENSQFPTEGVTVYVDLNSDKTFELYQVNVNNPGITSYKGTYSLDGSILSGKYSDGEAWAADYVVSELTTGTMVLAIEGTEDVSTYTKTEIPSSIKDGATPMAVRSDVEPRYL